MTKEKKLVLLFAVWATPVFLLLGVNDAFKNVSFDFLYHIPSYQYYINATRHTELARLSWMYSWLMSPLVITIMLVFFRDVRIGRTQSWRGMTTLLLFIPFFWLCAFITLDAYDSVTTGFGRWQIMYRETKIGVVLSVSIIWICTYLTFIAAAQWLLWIFKIRE